MATSTPEAGLASDQVLAIARADAEKVYRDLSAYCIRIVLESDGWHVDFDPKDLKHKGGGPHYVVHPTSGEIVTKRYDQ